MRVGRDALAVGFLAEVEQPLLAETALQKGARIDPGRGVPLYVNEVAAVRGIVGALPEVGKAGVGKQGRGLERGNVAAKLRTLLVGLQDDRRRVPADRRADPHLDCARAGMARLLVG